MYNLAYLIKKETFTNFRGGEINMMIKVNLFLAILLRIRTITSFKLNTGSANIIINFLIKLKNL